MLRIIHRVFVSSTFDDLREERSEIQKALLKLNCYPVGMELFPSADEETWDFIKRQIAESDYYLVVVAGRYGTLAPGGLGFTEQEYDYAREIKIPSIGFLHGRPENLPSKFVDSDPVLKKKLSAFKSKIQIHPCRFFENSHQLATEVVASVVDLRDRNPRPGFIRADDAPDFKKYADILEENVALRAQLGSAHETTPFPGADEKICVSSSTRSQIKRKKLHTGTTIGQLFYLYADANLTGANEQSTIEGLVLRKLFPKQPPYSLMFEDRQEHLKSFFGLGLFEYRDEIYQETTGGSSWTKQRRVWKLTQVGQKQYGVFAKLARSRKRAS